MPDFDPLIGMTIGKFRVLRKLGEGGMGTVYLADRTEDFHQHVALKLLLETGSQQSILQRFRIEQQALAVLRHPGIVQLVDAGVSDEGLPYIAMEVVDGEPIDRYCDSRNLSIKERLKLMLQVLDAVDYAHQRFLIHCDLKFDNILVDSSGAVKLLDFGVSKLLRPEAFGVANGATKMTMRPFTPEFASPEQLSATPLSTATDVYAAGVVLYGLLAGMHPFEELCHQPVKLLRAISEEEVRSASSAVLRLTRLDASRAESIARRRSAGAAALAAALRGDLDAILRKSLQNDAKVRYGNAAAMAADLRAYLSCRPVVARVPSMAYRTRRFLRRNRRLAAVAVFAIALSAAGFSSWIWQAMRASDSRAQAEARFSDVRQLTNTLLFDFYDAVQQLPGATRAQESLVRWSLQYLGELGRNSRSSRLDRSDVGLDLDIAESYWKLGNILGNPYQNNLGKPEEGVDTHTKGIQLVETIRVQDPGNRNAALMAAKLYGSRSQVRSLLDQSAECLADAREALSILEPLAESYPGDYEVQMQKTVQHEMLSDLIGGAYSVELNQDEARRQLRMAIEHAELAIQADQSQVRPRRAKVVIQYKLAELLSLDDPAAALAEFEDALVRFRQLPTETQAAPGSQRLRQILLRSIAWCQTALGNYGDALVRLRELEPEYREAIRLDPTNEQLRNDLAVLLRDVAEAHRFQGLYAECVADYRELTTLLGSQAHLKDMPQRQVMYGEMLAESSTCLHATGAHLEASRQSEHAVRMVTRAVGQDDVADSILIRGAAALLIGMPERNRRPQLALTLIEKRYTEGIADDPYYLLLKADALKQLGRRSEAREAARRALANTSPRVNINTWNRLQRILEGL